MIYIATTHSRTAVHQLEIHGALSADDARAIAQRETGAMPWCIAIIPAPISALAPISGPVASTNDQCYTTAQEDRMTVSAPTAVIARDVPAQVDYLTEGKQYPVTAFLGDAFSFTSDRGGKDLGLFENCNHGVNWEPVHA